MCSRTRAGDGLIAPAAAGRSLTRAWCGSGLLTNVLNPKIAVFYTGLLPSLVPAGGAPRVWLPVLVATHAVLSFVWLTSYSAALTRSRSVMGRPRVRRLLDRVTGCVLVGLGVRVAAGAR